jgi:hypothetical protein
MINKKIISKIEKMANTMQRPGWLLDLFWRFFRPGYIKPPSIVNFLMIFSFIFGLGFALSGYLTYARLHMISITVFSVIEALLFFVTCDFLFFQKRLARTMLIIAWGSFSAFVGFGFFLGIMQSHELNIISIVLILIFMSFFAIPIFLIFLKKSVKEFFQKIEQNRETINNSN